MTYHGLFQDKNDGKRPVAKEKAKVSAATPQNKGDNRNSPAERDQMEPDNDVQSPSKPMRAKLREGILMREILGPPRSQKPYRFHSFR